MEHSTVGPTSLAFKFNNAKTKRRIRAVVKFKRYTPFDDYKVSVPHSNIPIYILIFFCFQIWRRFITPRQENLSTDPVLAARLLQKLKFALYPSLIPPTPKGTSLGFSFTIFTFPIVFHESLSRHSFRLKCFFFLFILFCFVLRGKARASQYRICKFSSLF